MSKSHRLSIEIEDKATGSTLNLFPINPIDDEKGPEVGIEILYEGGDLVTLRIPYDDLMMAAKALASWKPLD